MLRQGSRSCCHVKYVNLENPEHYVTEHKLCKKLKSVHRILKDRRFIEYIFQPDVASVAVTGRLNFLCFIL